MPNKNFLIVQFVSFKRYLKCPIASLKSIRHDIEMNVFEFQRKIMEIHKIYYCWTAVM